MEEVRAVSKICDKSDGSSNNRADMNQIVIAKLSFVKYSLLCDSFIDKYIYDCVEIDIFLQNNKIVR